MFNSFLSKVKDIFADPSVTAKDTPKSHSVKTVKNKETGDQSDKNRVVFSSKKSPEVVNSVAQVSIQPQPATTQKPAITTKEAQKILDSAKEIQSQNFQKE